MEPPTDNKRTCFDGLSPKCGPALATAIAEIMSEGLSVQQMSVLANFIGSIAQSLSLIAAQQQVNEKNNIPPTGGVIS